MSNNIYRKTWQCNCICWTLWSHCSYIVRTFKLWSLYCVICKYLTASIEMGNVTYWIFVCCPEAFKYNTLIIKYLQDPNHDIVTALEYANAILQRLLKMRKNVVDEFENLFLNSSKTSIYDFFRNWARNFQNSGIPKNPYQSPRWNQNRVL